jgi:hypothetical protein
MADLLKAGQIKSLLQQITQARLNFEKRWYIVDRFMEGVHFDKVVKFKEGEVKLEGSRFVRGVEPITIARADKQIDSILNIIFSQKPVWKVYPLFNDSKAILNAQKISTFFDVIWDVAKIKRKIKKATKYALKYNVGYLEVGIDKNRNIFVEDYSPWQIYHDVGIENLNQTRFLVKVIRRPLEEIKLNSDYDQTKIKNLQPEKQTAISEYSDVRFKEKFAKIIEFENDDYNFVLLKEVWFKCNNKWYFGTECQGEWIREPVETSYESLPFVAVQIYEGDMYQTSLVEKLIPLNKEIDLLSAYIKNFVYSTAMGKFLEPRGSKIERIVDEHGERIRYEPGREPSILQTPQLNPAIITFLELLTNWMDERGVAVLSFGKLPSKRLGWQALESLKQIEIGNMQGIIENITEALQDLGYKILEAGVIAWTDSVYTIMSPLEETIKVLSDDVYGTTAEFSREEIVPISTKWGIKVEIESGLAYTEEGKRMTLIELLKAGIVTPEEVREKLKLGPTPVKDVEELKEAEIQTKIEESLPPEFRNLQTVEHYEVPTE